MPMPVDTRRSWVFLGTGFYVNLIVHGIGHLSGMFFVASMAKFNVGRTAASFPYTFCSFVEYICGPIIGYLGHNFGIHKIIIIGSLFSTFGLMACSFVENIGFISLFYGVFYGIGGGTILLVPVLINMHFYKYRAVASGIYSSASSCGKFIFPPVTEILLGKYDLSVTFLIFAGLVFTNLPATLLMRSMKSDDTSEKHPNSFIWRNTEKQPLLQDEKTVKVYTENASSQKNMTTQKEENHLKPDLCRQSQEVVSISNESRIAENLDKSKKNVEKCESVCRKIEENDKENFYSSEKNAEDNKDIPKDTLKSSKSILPPRKSSNKSQKVTFRSLISDPVFICLALEIAFYAFINISFLTVIVDFARDIGLSDQEQAYTVTLLSIGELIGPLCLGWIVDKSYMKKTTFLAIACFSQALIVVIAAFSNGSLMLFSVLGAKGFVKSAQSFVLPLLFPEYLPENSQTIAMPSIHFLSAPGTLLISPLIGYLREGLGSYVYMFYILGILSITCGLMFLIIECLSKRRK